MNSPTCMVLFIKGKGFFSSNYKQTSSPKHGKIRDGIKTRSKYYRKKTELSRQTLWQEGQTQFPSYFPPPLVINKAMPTCAAQIPENFKMLFVFHGKFCLLFLTHQPSNLILRRHLKRHEFVENKIKSALFFYKINTRDNLHSLPPHKNKHKDLCDIIIERVSARRPSGRPLRLGLVEFFRVFFFVLFF